MSPKPSLRRIRKWPRWIIIPIGLLLAMFAIVLGLFLEPAGYALSPGEVEPTPTLPAIDYSRTLSDGCHDCHVSLPLLRASATDPTTAEAYLIEPESVMTPHGTLGCMACHGGNGQATDKETGHQGLIVDISQEDPKQCIICHSDLPVEIPGDRLRVPHQIVENWIVHGEPGTLFCSDCHGGVGHGFDPVSGDIACSMNVCVDCHVERQLEVQLADCEA
ncbi:MAG: cytochrome c3 family protein, partial [Anaerolineae bacterium]